MGVSLQVMVTSQKRMATLPDGEKVVVFGYRTCGRGEFLPSGSIKECREIQDTIAYRAMEGVLKHNPRYIVLLSEDFVDRKNKWVFNLAEGSVVYRVNDGECCPGCWWDNKAPSNTSPVGLLKKSGKRWIVVKELIRECSSTAWDENGQTIKRNRCREYINGIGEYTCEYYWDDRQTNLVPVCS